MQLFQLLKLELVHGIDVEKPPYPQGGDGLGKGSAWCKCPRDDPKQRDDALCISIVSGYEVGVSS